MTHIEYTVISSYSSLDIECDVVSPEEIEALGPVVKEDDLMGGVFGFLEMEFVILIKYASHWFKKLSEMV